MTTKGVNFPLTATYKAGSAFRRMQSDLKSTQRHTRDASHHVTKYRSELTRLQNRFNPTAAAAARAEREIQDLNRALAMGVVSQKSYASQMRNLQKTVDLGNVANLRFSQTLGGSSWRRQVQQAGMQVSDFAVQVAGGQSAILAFTQNAPQFVQNFGAIGGVLAAGITILGTLAFSYAKARKALKSFSEELEDAQDGVESYIKLSSLLQQSNVELGNGFEDAGGKIKSAINALAEVKLAEAQRSIDNMSEALAGLTSTRGDGERRGELAKIFDANIFMAFNKEQRAARKEARLLTHNYITLSDALVDAKGNANEQFNVLSKMLPLSEKLADFSGDRTDKENEIISAIAEQLRIVGELTTKSKTHYVDILGSEKGLAAAVAASNALYAARIGTIDDTANNYVDILGSEEGLTAAVAASNALYAARIGTIDDTANNYVDILGSEKGLATAVAASNALYTARLGTIDKIANNYVDILGSEEGLAAAVAANNALYAARIGTIDDTANNYVDILGSEEGLAAAVAANNALWAERMGIGAPKGKSAEESAAERVKKQLNELVNEAHPALRKLLDETEGLTLKVAERIEDVFTRTQQSISQSMSASFKSLLDESKSFGEATRDILGSILNNVINILMTPIFNNIAGSLAGGIMGGLGNIGASFDGGGFTGAGVRAGGMDGKGGKLAMVHPNETVVDHTKGQSVGGNTVVFNISTPDVAGFQKSQRQLARQAKAVLG